RDAPGAEQGVAAGPRDLPSTGMALLSHAQEGYRALATRLPPQPSGRGATFQFVEQTLDLGATGHHVEHFLLADVFLGERAHRLAAIEQGEAVADWIGVMHVVRDEDHRDAALACLMDQLEHVAALLDAERGISV